MPDKRLQQHTRYSNMAYLLRCCIYFPYGEQKAEERLQKYSDYVKANDLPNKWTFPSFFLFMTDPTEEISIKTAIVEALLSDASENPQAAVPSDEKSKRYATFFKVSQAKDDTKVELSTEDIVLIKKVCWLAKPTLIAGQIDHILES